MSFSEKYGIVERWIGGQVVFLIQRSTFSRQRTGGEEAWYKKIVIRKLV